MYSIKNDKSQLANNINLNINMISIIEILLNSKWVDRICNIQANWTGNFKYAEISFDNGMYVYLLMNHARCYVNLQDFKEPQIYKQHLDNYNLPKQLKEFILTEPVFSYGTTNLMWSNGAELFSLKDKLNRVFPLMYEAL
jgi:hypothetical protein